MAFAVDRKEPPLHQGPPGGDVVQRRMRLHLDLALKGQIAALDGDYSQALELYREAINLAVSSGAPEVFFRYYSQCVLESLEHLESYAEIIDFCNAADEHHRTINAPLPIHRRDHAAILERLGLSQLKAGLGDQGRAALGAALEIGPEELPICKEVLGWLDRGFAVSASRIVELQKKHRYFVVRPDNRSQPTDITPDDHEEVAR